MTTRHRVDTPPKLKSSRFCMTIKLLWNYIQLSASFATWLTSTQTSTIPNEIWMPKLPPHVSIMLKWLPFLQPHLNIDLFLMIEIRSRRAYSLTRESGAKINFFSLRTLEIFTWNVCVQRAWNCDSLNIFQEHFHTKFLNFPSSIRHFEFISFIHRLLQYGKYFRFQLNGKFHKYLRIRRRNQEEFLHSIKGLNMDVSKKTR